MVDQQISVRLHLWLVLMCLGIGVSMAQPGTSIPQIDDQKLEWPPIQDSLDLEQVIDRIEQTGRDARLSLSYIALYESLVAQHPHIPHRMQQVQLLKGYRYNSLAWQNKKEQGALALRYLDTAQQHFAAADFAQGRWLNQYGRANVYKFAGENERALQLFDDYLAHFSDPFDSAYVANVQFQRGVVLMQLGRFTESTAALLQAVQLDEGLGRISSQANTLNTLANVYKRAGLTTEAEQAYQQALAVYQQHDLPVGQAQIHLNYANYLVEQGELASARKNYFRALPLSIDHPNLLSYVYSNLGNFHMLQEQYDSSLHYLEQAYTLRKNSDNPRELYLIEHKIGRLHLRANRLAQALPYLQSAFAVAQQQGEQESIRDIALDLSQWYEKRKAYQEALRYQQYYAAAKDSLLNKDIAAQIAEINTRYETEKKEQSIALLSAQTEAQQLRITKSQRSLFFALAGFLLLTLLTLQFYRGRQKEKELNASLAAQNKLIQKALQEKDVLLREIHHRVKNNLQVISSLLSIQSRSLEDENAVAALNEGRSRVQTMSLIHQDLYQQDQLTGIDMRPYFEKLVHNLFTTYNVSQERIQLVAEIDELRLDVDTVIPLGLIINELMSNAFKYAFPLGAGTIHVSLKEKEGALHLSVRDDGVGMTEAPALHDGHSYGYELIEALVDKLDGKLEIQVDGGTQIKAVFHTYQKAA